MAQEEKAKAYDEAFEDMRVIYPNLKGDAKLAVEHAFPQLRESEDERIRKAMLQHFKNKTKEKGCNIPVKDIISWLEKQKELFESGKGLYYYDGEKTTYCGYPATEDNPYDFAMSQQEKQKEQKPADEQFPPLEGLDAIKAKYYDDGFKNGFDEGVASVKPAEWSKEDNIGWDEAFACVTRAEKAAKNEEELQNAVTAEKWLKEIKFKYYVHPVKQEWSEEDEVMLKEIIAFFKDGSVKLQHDLDLYAGFLEKRLKSLRPQPKEELILLDENIITAAVAFVDLNPYNCWCGIDKHTVIKALRSLKPSWKPSEEQMRALQNAVALAAGNKVLAGLYEHLKKLM